MPHFLIKSNQAKNNLISIDDKDLIKHLSGSLRIKIGEDVKFIDEDENVYLSKITMLDKNTLCAQIIKQYKSFRKAPYDINLIQCVLKSDAQNLAISNAVQTGVKTIFPVVSQNCTLGLAAHKEKPKKWRKIAVESFKQCERADLPEIFEVSNLIDTLKNLNTAKKNIFIFAEKDCNIYLKKAIATIDKTAPIYAVIGPEGGFSDKEFTFFKEKNYNLISLGNLIYKAPNAIIAAVSNILYGLEND